MKKLLNSLLLGNPSILTKAELSKIANSEIVSALQQQNILRKTHLKTMLCPECEGHTIEVQCNDEKYYGYCHESDIGKISILEEDVEAWQLDVTDLLKCFIRSTENQNQVIENVEGLLWSLGSCMLNGQQYSVYFTPSLKQIAHRNESQTIAGTLHPILLYIEYLTATKMPDNIALVPFKKIIHSIDSQDGIIFETEQYNFYFPEVADYEAEGDLWLDEHITLSPENQALYFGKITKGKVQKKSHLMPKAVKLIEHLYQIKNYEHNSRSADELANAMFSKSKGSLRNSIREIENACNTYKVKSIIDKNPKEEYRLNPRLDCFQ